MRIDEKKSIVESLHEKFVDAKIVILTDYKGLDVESMNSLRRKLREANVEYKVVKNTLTRRAAKDTGVALLDDHLKGPNALAFSLEDPVAPAKVLKDFAKDNNKLEIKVGVMEGKMLSLDDLNALSSLPSKEVLLGQLLSVMNGVPTSLVRALNDVPVRLLNVLQAIKEKQEAASLESKTN